MNNKTIGFTIGDKVRIKSSYDQSYADIGATGIVLKLLSSGDMVIKWDEFSKRASKSDFTRIYDFCASAVNCIDLEKISKNLFETEE